MEFALVVVGIAVVGAVIAAALPASRAMRADLVRRAYPGEPATRFAHQVANRSRLSWLDYAGACRKVDELRTKDREDELLGQSAGRS